jgi:hypothetical protein
MYSKRGPTVCEIAGSMIFISVRIPFPIRNAAVFAAKEVKLRLHLYSSLRVKYVQLPLQTSLAAGDAVFGFVGSLFSSWCGGILFVSEFRASSIFFT